MSIKERINQWIYSTNIKGADELYSNYVAANKRIKEIVANEEDYKEFIYKYWGHCILSRFYKVARAKSHLDNALAEIKEKDYFKELSVLPDMQCNYKSYTQEEIDDTLCKLLMVQIEFYDALGNYYKSVRSEINSREYNIFDATTSFPLKDYSRDKTREEFLKELEAIGYFSFFDNIIHDRYGKESVDLWHLRDNYFTLTKYCGKDIEQSVVDIAKMLGTVKIEEFCNREEYFEYDEEIGKYFTPEYIENFVYILFTPIERSHNISPVDYDEVYSFEGHFNNYMSFIPFTKEAEYFKEQGTDEDSYLVDEHMHWAEKLTVPSVFAWEDAIMPEWSSIVFYASAMCIMEVGDFKRSKYYPLTMESLDFYSIACPELKKINPISMIMRMSCIRYNDSIDRYPSIEKLLKKKKKHRPNIVEFENEDFKEGGFWYF